MGSESGFRGERFGLSWGTIRAFVGSGSGFRGERVELSWGAIRTFVGRDSDFRGSDSGFLGKEFGLSRCVGACGGGGDSGFRGEGFRVSRGGSQNIVGGIARKRTSLRQRSQSGQPKPILIASRSIDNLREFPFQAKNFKTED